jgi:hypothetical protein
MDGDKNVTRQVEKATNDDDSDSDEWYEKMAQQSSFIDEFSPEILQMQNQATQAGNEMDDTQYFNQIAQNNIEISENCFKNESDMIWQGLLRQVQSNPASEKKTPAKSNSLLSEIPLTAAEIESNQSTLFLLKQWLFSFLPGSSEFYHMIDTLLTKTNYWVYYDNNNNQEENDAFKVFPTLYVDNFMHPSFIALFRCQINKNTESTASPSSPSSSVLRLELLVYTSLPLYHKDNRELVTKLTSELFSQIQKKIHSFPETQQMLEKNQNKYQIMLVGIDTEYFEQILLPFCSNSSSTSLSSSPTMKFRFSDDWRDICYMYSYEPAGSQTTPAEAFSLTPEEKETMERNQFSFVTLK